MVYTGCLYSYTCLDPSGLALIPLELPPNHRCIIRCIIHLGPNSSPVSTVPPSFASLPCATTMSVIVSCIDSHNHYHFHSNSPIIRSLYSYSIFNIFLLATPTMFFPPSTPCLSSSSLSGGILSNYGPAISVYHQQNIDAREIFQSSPTRCHYLHQAYLTVSSFPSLQTSGSCPVLDGPDRWTKHWGKAYWHVDVLQLFCRTISGNSAGMPYLRCLKPYGVWHPRWTGAWTLGLQQGPAYNTHAVGDNTYMLQRSARNYIFYVAWYVDSKL